jgi:O-methyltransferase involved in polyketide biosynthesis
VELPDTNVVRVEIDFETQALTDVLPGAGFARDAATFVVWEGVPMYLTRAG